MVIIKFSHLEKLPTVVYEGDLMVREFATTELGHTFDLILCGGVAGKVKK